MLDLVKTAQARGLVKWGTCALILLAPGSFVVLPLLWLVRHWPARSGTLVKMRERTASGLSAAQSPKIA